MCLVFVCGWCVWLLFFFPCDFFGESFHKYPTIFEKFVKHTKTFETLTSLSTHVIIIIIVIMLLIFIYIIIWRKRNSTVGGGGGA